VGIPAGLKFNTCDLIFAHEGGAYYNENRLEWLVVKCLEQNENSGNTYAHIKNIMFWVNKLSKLSPVFNEEVPESLIVRACFNSKKIVCEQSSPEFRYYLKKTYYEEKSIVSHLQRIQSSKTPLCFNEKLIKAIEKKNGVTYAEKQKLAFELLKSTGIKVVTGGPGTGKTTTVNGLIQAYHKMYPNNTILLCAPTGRAAQRLSEATSKKAFTLHKALDIKPFGDNDIQSRTLESNPLEADFIIVDEMSMTDTSIFSILLGAIKSDTLVLLCGDTDQLPSVGAGNILHDIIASDFVEKVQLDVVYRQAKESGITENAIKVNSGNSDLVKKDDFSTYKLDSQKELSDKVCELVSCYYKKDDPFAVQVLSSTKQGDAGTVLLNRKLQMLCNENKTLTELEFNLKCGDKVMLTRNNYDIGYVNGDIGIITNIDSDYITIDIKGLAVTKVPRKYMSDISLAYAITIHKSQGSEYDTVVIALPSEPRVMLKRNLLYTAITRAKKRVILVTEQGSVEYAVNTLDTELRQTSILEKLVGQPKAIF
jgi:exodeoxyribonuclease V alpha subunit